MQWKLTRHPYGGWMIEYKNGVLGGWQKVNGARHYQWEPSLPAVFNTKKEASAEMAKLISNVTDVGTDRSMAIFGDIRQGAKVIRTMPLFVVPEYDRIFYEGKAYKDVTTRTPALRNSIIVQEVASNE